MEQLYVDDYLGRTDSIEAAKQRVEETNNLFKEACLNMRSYATNCEELRQFLEERGLENQTIGLLSPSMENQQKVLGIRCRVRWPLCHYVVMFPYPALCDVPP